MPSRAPRLLDPQTRHLAVRRRTQRVLGGFAAAGWVTVLIGALVADRLDRTGGNLLTAVFMDGLLGLWVLSIVVWLVLRVAESVHPPDPLGSRRAAVLLMGLTPLPWVRLVAAALLTLALPGVVQDLAAAGAGVLHLGPHVQFIADHYSYGGKGSVLSHGSWTDGGGEHDAVAMDATPALGRPLLVRRPPLGGVSVYAGGFYSWVACFFLLTTLVCFVLLVRSTLRALRSAELRVPHFMPALGTAPAPAPRGRAPHRVAIHPSRPLTLRPEPRPGRRSRAFDRNAAMTATDNELVLVDRKGRRHSFPIVHRGRDKEGAAYALGFISTLYDNGRMLTPLIVENVYVLDRDNVVLAEIESDGWDLATMRTWARGAGLQVFSARLADERVRDKAYPLPQGIPVIKKTGTPEVLLWLVGSIVGGGVVLATLLWIAHFAGRWSQLALWGLLCTLPFASASVVFGWSQLREHGTKAGP